MDGRKLPLNKKICNVLENEKEDIQSTFNSQCCENGQDAEKLTKLNTSLNGQEAEQLTENAKRHTDSQCKRMNQIVLLASTSSTTEVAGVSSFENGENENEADQLTSNAKRCRAYRQNKKLNTIVSSRNASATTVGDSDLPLKKGKRKAEQLTINIKRCCTHIERKQVNENEADQPTLNAIRCRRYRQRKKLNTNVSSRNPNVTTVGDSELLLKKGKEVNENEADQPTLHALRCRAYRKRKKLNTIVSLRNASVTTVGNSESLLKKLLLQKGKRVNENEADQSTLNAKRCRVYRQRKKLKTIVSLANLSVTTAVDGEFPLKKGKRIQVNEVVSLAGISGTTTDATIKTDKKGVNYNYKKCFVPSCQNTSLNSKKIFISVPKVEDIRKAWSVAVGLREVPSTSSVDIDCCEDHFIMKQDCENWIAYNFCCAQVKLKTDVVPHRNLSELPDVSRKFSQLSKVAEERKRKIKEEFEEESSTLTSTEPGTGSASFLDELSMFGLHTSFAHKSVQANFEIAKSSVSIGVNTT